MKSQIGRTFVWQIVVLLMKYLRFDQHGHVHEHVVQLSNGVFKFDDISVTGFNVRKRLLCLLGVSHNLMVVEKVSILVSKFVTILTTTHPLSEYCRIPAFKHLFEFFICRRPSS